MTSLVARSLSLAALLLTTTTDAFSVVRCSRPPAFRIRTASASRGRTTLHAEGGAPQYDRVSASVISNTEVGRGSFLIRVAPNNDAVDNSSSAGADDVATPKIDYEPGHVLALEIRNPDGEADEAASVFEGEEWMRGPYTVSRCDGNSFEVMYRVVGKKTRVFQAAKAGTAVQFGGKFKVPILEGIDRTGLERVVLISTGVGVGPMIGFAEKALGLPEDEKLFANDGGKIELYAAFREEEDVCSAEVLDQLAASHPDEFSWTPIISSEVGRVSDAPTLSCIAKGLADVSPGSTHYHLVGNGSMVNEWKEGLTKAGVLDERVTIEMYFNHKEKARPEAVDAIAVAMKESAMIEA